MRRLISLRFAARLTTLAAVFAFCCCTTLFTSPMRAQCPDASTPDPGPAWSSDFRSPMTLYYGPDCTVQVYFCSRVNPLVGTEFYITAIVPVAPSTCPTENPINVIRFALANVAENTVLECDDYPLCGGGGQEVDNYYLAECWDYTEEGVGSGPGFGPCYGSATCKKVYTRCCDPDNGFVETTYVSTSEIPSPDNMLCLEAPDGPWLTDICYTVSCQ